MKRNWIRETFCFLRISIWWGCKIVFPTVQQILHTTHGTRTGGNWRDSPWSPIVLLSCSKFNRLSLLSSLLLAESPLIVTAAVQGISFCCPFPPEWQTGTEVIASCHFNVCLQFPFRRNLNSFSLSERTKRSEVELIFTAQLPVPTLGVKVALQGIPLDQVSLPPLNPWNGNIERVFVRGSLWIN